MSESDEPLPDPNTLPGRFVIEYVEMLAGSGSMLARDLTGEAQLVDPEEHLRLLSRLVRVLHAHTLRLAEEVEDLKRDRP